MDTQRILEIGILIYHVKVILHRSRTVIIVRMAKRRAHLHLQHPRRQLNQVEGLLSESRTENLSIQEKGLLAKVLLYYVFLMYILRDLRRKVEDY